MPTPETLQREICDLRARLRRTELLLAQIPHHVDRLIAHTDPPPPPKPNWWLTVMIGLAGGATWVSSTEWTTP